MTRRSNLQKKRLRRTICITLMLVLVVIAFPRIRNIAQLYEQRDALLERKAQLEQQKAELEEKIKSLDDLPTIERTAREKLGLVRPGERIITEQQK